MAKAAERVHARLSDELAAQQTAVAPARSYSRCEDFQTLIPSYLKGSCPARARFCLRPTRECVPCRKRSSKRAPAAVSQALSSGSQRIAALVCVGQVGSRATLIIGLGAISYPWLERLLAQSSCYGTVSAMKRFCLYGFRPATVRHLKPSSSRRASAYAAKDAGAVVRLADGSLSR